MPVKNTGQIYLDHAATTPLDERVFTAMLPYLRDHYGNASSTHRLGRITRVAVEESRERIAAHLNAEPSEIIFTSGGTESDNAALHGVLGHTNKGLVTSSIEHSAILAPSQALQDSGHTVVRILPESDGKISAEQVSQKLTTDIGMVSFALVNNEIGTIMPLVAISSVCREKGIPLHTDAVQAPAFMKLDVDTLGVDLLSLSAHKMYGPKGIGVLYVRSGTDFKPWLTGGAQERKRRGGTQNVAAIVGMAKALDLVSERREKECARLMELRKFMERCLEETLGDSFVFNSPVDGFSAPHILNVAMLPAGEEQIDGEMLHLNMDLAGVFVSAGAACSSGAVQASHVLQGIGLEKKIASTSVRFSLGKDTSTEDVETAVSRLGKIIHRMRARLAG